MIKEVLIKVHDNGYSVAMADVFPGEQPKLVDMLFDDKGSMLKFVEEKLPERKRSGDRADIS